MRSFPLSRLRRSRINSWGRDLIAETRLSADDLILPIFVQESNTLQTAIHNMPETYRYSIAGALKYLEKACALGIKACIIFPCVDSSLKDEQASYAYANNNIVCRLIREIKRNIPSLGVISDVALDPYTSHGHDGVLNSSNSIDNDKTISLLSKQALLLADAGCDILAPSDMMDGRIQGIRVALEQNQFYDVQILSYAAKYASCFYSPFRGAVGSKDNLGTADKTSYQMDIRNSREAIEETMMDIQEGADLIMVKPAMNYLDIVKVISDRFNLPVFAYQVSGEYAMLMQAVTSGILERDKAINESIIAIKRSGASCIVTYAAMEVAEYIRSSDNGCY